MKSTNGDMETGQATTRRSPVKVSDETECKCITVISEETKAQLPTGITAQCYFLKGMPGQARSFQKEDAHFSLNVGFFPV